MGTDKTCSAWADTMDDSTNNNDEVSLKEMVKVMNPQERKQLHKEEENRNANEKEGGSKNEMVSLFSIEKTDAPFLVGVRGRNISIIRKFTGMLISISDDVVKMIPSRPHNTNPELAWRMVLSACYGGILRWFETPFATSKGYPNNKVDELQSIAASYNCTLDLLRSRRGHMCLMLIPILTMQSSEVRPAEEEITATKMRLQNARKELLSTMNIPTNSNANRKSTTSVPKLVK